MDYLSQRLHPTSTSTSVFKVTIDVTDAHFWDTTSINALDKVVIKFRQQGAEVELVGLNPQGKAIVESLAIYTSPTPPVLIRRTRMPLA